MLNVGPARRNTFRLAHQIASWPVGFPFGWFRRECSSNGFCNLRNGRGLTSLRPTRNRIARICGYAVRESVCCYNRQKALTLPSERFSRFWQPTTSADGRTTGMRQKQIPYFFAAAYSLTATVIALPLDPIPPRFMDLYLVGIMYSTFRWSWRPAALIYLLSLAGAAWILPRFASVAVSGGANGYRMLSYTVTAVFAMQVIEIAKRAKM